MGREFRIMVFLALAFFSAMKFFEPDGGIWLAPAFIFFYLFLDTINQYPHRP